MRSRHRDVTFGHLSTGTVELEVSTSTRNCLVRPGWIYTGADVKRSLSCLNALSASGEGGRSQLHERSRYFTIIPDKAVIKMSKSQEPLKLFATVRDWPLCYCLDFNWVYPHLPLLNNEARKQD